MLDERKEACDEMTSVACASSKSAMSGFTPYKLKKRSELCEVEGSWLFIAKEGVERRTVI